MTDSGRQGVLPPAPRAHQLPPKWDGCTVEWEGWQRDDTTLRFHMRGDCCPHCGSLTDRVFAAGMVRADGPRGVLALHKARGYQLGRLYAFRCPDCQHDQVTDLAGITWDLDDTDYGDDGSWSR